MKVKERCAARFDTVQKEVKCQRPKGHDGRHLMTVNLWWNNETSSYTMKPHPEYERFR